MFRKMCMNPRFFHNMFLPKTGYFCVINTELIFINTQRHMSNTGKMNRREALKHLGILVASTASATTGLFSLTSCTEKKVKRIILYFTGTGNCLHIARQLAEENTELLSIPQLIKQGIYNLKADEIGIVYPIYGHMPPHMVRTYIQKAKLEAAYKFAILTYGARKCNAVEIWNEITQKVGHTFDYINTIIMVDNWLPNFDMSEQMKIDKRIPENLKAIKSDLNKHRRWHQPVTEEERLQHAGFIKHSGIDPEIGFLKRSEKYFVITNKCIGCGVCTDMCPRGNFKLSSEGVYTEGDCEFCFACIQNCPQKAIRFAHVDNDPLLANGEINPNARYRNEHVSLYDLKQANSQKG